MVMFEPRSEHVYSVFIIFYYIIKIYSKFWEILKCWIICWNFNEHNSICNSFMSILRQEGTLSTNMETQNYEMIIKCIYVPSTECQPLQSVSEISAITDFGIFACIRVQDLEAYLVDLDGLKNFTGSWMPSGW